MITELVRRLRICKSAIRQLIYKCLFHGYRSAYIFLVSLFLYELLISTIGGCYRK